MIPKKITSSDGARRAFPANESQVFMDRMAPLGSISEMWRVSVQEMEHELMVSGALPEAR